VTANMVFMAGPRVAPFLDDEEANLSMPLRRNGRHRSCASVNCSRKNPPLGNDAAIQNYRLLDAVGQQVVEFALIEIAIRSLCPNRPNLTTAVETLPMRR